MKDSRLRDVPRMKWGDSTVPAEYYNRIRLGLLRLKGPLRIDTGLRDIDMVLEDKVWYCVDRTMNDLPILAWDMFQPRSSLHEPIPCRLSYYHAHAEKILDKVLKAVNLYLERRLAQQQGR